jgi:hypothetical protein
MPGKSKKDGGLEVESAYKMKGFPMHAGVSPMKQVVKPNYTASDSTDAQNLAYDIKEGNYTGREKKSVIEMAHDANPNAVKIYEGVKNQVITDEYTTADIDAGVPEDDAEYVDFHTSKTMNRMIRKNKKGKTENRSFGPGVKATHENTKGVLKPINQPQPPKNTLDFGLKL